MGALISQSSYSLESMPIWLLNRPIGPGRNDGGILRWWLVFSQDRRPYRQCRQ